MQTKTIGFALVVIGILMMIYTGINIITTEKVVDIGPLHMTKEENHPVQWSPIIGGLLLVGGIVLVASNKGKKA